MVGGQRIEPDGYGEFGVGVIAKISEQCCEMIAEFLKPLIEIVLFTTKLRSLVGASATQALLVRTALAGAPESFVLRAEPLG